MTWYGGPEHILQDGYGNRRAGVVIELFASQEDAQAQANALATATSNGGGLWPVWADADEVWARIPGAPGKPPVIEQLRGLAQASDVTALADRVTELENTPAPTVIAYDTDGVPYLV